MSAQTPFPHLHDVAGVADDDVLNVRAEPSADAEIVGELSPDRKGVEILLHDPSGKWGMINSGEGVGWVALRYLSQLPEPGDYILQKTFQCFGTEPFWNLDIRQGEIATYSSPEQPTTDLPAGLLKTSRGRTDRYLLGLGESALLVVSHGTCSDGMSDRQYGLEASLIRQEPELELQSGCCTLSNQLSE